MATFYNGKHLTDTDGNIVHCHGAGFMFHEGWYYMFGEDRRGKSRVSCYRSKDLVKWEFRNIVLSLDSSHGAHYIRTDYSLAPNSRGAGPEGANIERPKVLYCEKTGKFVMWMHYENGRDYNAAQCAVAVCDTVDGDYVYLGSFNPVGNMSRDCTLFKDDDGSAYFISSARDNADTVMYRLAEDFLSVDEQVKVLWPGQFREAPVVIKKNGYYFLFSSQCTGWNPNQGGYATASSLTGKWSMIRPLGNETTFNTQPTAALDINGDILYIGDRWDPIDYMNSKIVYLPVSFPEKDECVLNWASEVEITESGITYKASEPADFRIMNHRCYEYVGGDGYSVYGKTLAYADEELLWTKEEAEGGFMLRHSASGKYLSAEGVLAEKSQDERLVWNTLEAVDGVVLVNKHSDKALLVHGRRVIIADKEDARRDGYKFVTNY